MHKVILLFIIILFLPYSSISAQKVFNLTENTSYGVFDLDDTFFCAYEYTNLTVEVYSTVTFDKLYEFKVESGRGPGEIETILGFFIENGILHFAGPLRVLLYDLNKREFLDEFIPRERIWEANGVRSNILYFSTLNPRPNSALFGSVNLQTNLFTEYKSSSVEKNPEFDPDNFRATLGLTNNMLTRLSYFTGKISYLNLATNMFEEFFIDEVKNELEKTEEGTYTNIIFTDHILLNDTTIVLSAEGRSEVMKYEKNVVYRYDLVTRGKPSSVYTSKLKNISKIRSNKSILLLIDVKSNQFEVVKKADLDL